MDIELVLLNDDVDTTATDIGTSKQTDSMSRQGRQNRPMPWVDRDVKIDPFHGQTGTSK